MYNAFISYKFFFQSMFWQSFPPNLLRMTQYDQFHLIWNFSNLFSPSGSESLWMANLPNSQLFQSFPTETAQNCS